MIEELTAVGLSLLLVIVWFDDAGHTWGEWAQYRDTKALRTMLKATLIASGTISFLLGALTRYVWPELLDAARLVGWIVRGEMIVVGLVIFGTRHAGGIFRRLDALIDRIRGE